MRRSFSLSSSLIEASGMPVHRDTTSSMSRRSTMGRSKFLSSQRSRMNWRLSRWAISSSRYMAARSKSLFAIALSMRSAMTRMRFFRSAKSVENVGLAQLHPRARLVEQVDGLVGQESVRDVAVRLVNGGIDRLFGVRDVMELLVALFDAHSGSRWSRPRSGSRP